MGWTNERVKLLKKLWDEGLTARQISVRMESFSRNAIIGKVHRLKLPGRPRLSSTQKQKEKLLESNLEDYMENTSSYNNSFSLLNNSDEEKKRYVSKNNENAEVLILDTVLPIQFLKEMTVSASLNFENKVVPENRKVLLQQKEQTETISESAQRDKNFEKSNEQRTKEHTSLEERNSMTSLERRLSLSQLTDRSCRWPIGDPLSDDFYFCGADTGESGPYCSYHAKVAFQPISERRRIRI